jgi:2-dehydro-3-deoxygluconokinase
MNNLNTKAGKVLSFGELLLRVCPDSEGIWLNSNTLPFYIGGAEVNVARALSLWNIPSAYMTVMPDNSMSQQILEFLRSENIDTSGIILQGERLGLYYLTRGKDLKNAAVIYDRKHSSFAELKTGVVSWDEVFQDVTWFHFSAISPALNQHTADVCKEALKAASRRGITISVDLNYRSKLWQYGKLPAEIMPELVQHCDMIMGNIWAAGTMLDIPPDENLKEGSSKESYIAQAERSSIAMMKRFPSCKAVANTFRFDQKEGVKYYSSLYTGGKLYSSSEYNSGKIIDKVGSGDCYMAGLIYGFYTHLSAKETIEFATAAAFSKLKVEGDATNKTVQNINEEIIRLKEML